MKGVLETMQPRLTKINSENLKINKSKNTIEKKDEAVTTTTSLFQMQSVHTVRSVNNGMMIKFWHLASVHHSVESEMKHSRCEQIQYFQL